MNTNLIRRRSNWADAAALEKTAGVSTRIVNEEMPHQVRWIRSYVVAEDDGRLGTACIYQAVDEAASMPGVSGCRLTRSPASTPRW